MKQTQESQSSWCVYVSSATRSLQFHMNPLLARSHRTSWMPKLGQKTESLDTEQSQSLLPQFMKTSQPKPGDYILPVSFSPRFKINLTFELSLSLSLFRLPPDSFNVRMDSKIIFWSINTGELSVPCGWAERIYQSHHSRGCMFTGGLANVLQMPALSAGRCSFFC